MILFRWHGIRQQQGWACITVTKLPGLPVLAPRTVTQGQADHFRAILDAFKQEPLLPANEAYRNETRNAFHRKSPFGIASMLRLDPGLEEGLTYCGNSGAPNHPSTAARALESMNDRSLDRPIADTAEIVPGWTP